MASVVVIQLMLYGTTCYRWRLGKFLSAKYHRSLVQVPSNKMSQYWPRSVLPHAITREQLVISSLQRSLSHIYFHFCDVIMATMASQITSPTVVYSTVYSNAADQRRYQCSASLAFFAGSSPGNGEFPAQVASNAENVSIWWRHHVVSDVNSMETCEKIPKWPTH